MKYVDTTLTARYQETDKMGVIHHSVYPVWYEASRTELIKESGYTYTSLENIGLMLPLIRLESQYILPSFYEDEVTVRCCISELTKTRISISYEVYRKEDPCNVINKGVTVHVFTDNTMKPLNIIKKYPGVYEAFNRIYE